MKEIGLATLGKVPEVVLRRVGAQIEAAFDRTAVRLGEMGIPPEAFVESRGQYFSHAFLQAMADKEWPEGKSGCEKVLGITAVDLATPVLTFVFGEAHLGGRFGIVSLARLEQEFYGLPANEGLLLSRAVKESVHELGHLYGLVHCTHERCVMFFSRHIQDVDEKGVDFCSRCWPVLSEKREGT
jgi:archaemetzincin